MLKSEVTDKNAVSNLVHNLFTMKQLEFSQAVLGIKGPCNIVIKFFLSSFETSAYKHNKINDYVILDLKSEN